MCLIPGPVPRLICDKRGLNTTKQWLEAGSILRICVYSRYAGLQIIGTTALFRVAPDHGLDLDRPKALRMRTID